MCPDGSKIEEPCYRGDECFGGQNAYALLANWNWPKECTGDSEKDAEIGKEAGWTTEDNIKFPIKLVRNPDLNFEDVGASEFCEFNGWDYDIEEWPEDSEILNKYSEDKILEYCDKWGEAIVEVHYPWSDEIRAEAIHFILGYSHSRLPMYMPNHSYAKSNPTKYYEDDDMLIWIPKNEIFNFFQTMVENENSFVIGNGGFIY